MKQVVTIVGARPQFIKAAALSKALDADGLVHEIMIHTGQHYNDEMSAVFFRELGIKSPDYSLGIGSGSHGAQTGRMLAAIEEVLMSVRPDGVLVFGDTNSTLAGALAASKLHIRVAHVEAGLRSFNRAMPEEINRILTDHCSDLLFAPTEGAVRNLEREGFNKDRTYLVGDLMYDAAISFSDQAQTQSRVLQRLGLQPKAYILATIHRAETTDTLNQMRAVVEGLRKVGEIIEVVLPTHPRTRQALDKYRLLEPLGEKVKLVDPVGYLDMIMLERNARLVVTDSGGVQKEAFFQRTPCVTLRNETEWVELVDTGWNRLCPPTNPEAILSLVVEALDSKGADVALYGGGHAAERIVHILHKELAG